MTTLYELVDQEELQQMIAEGRIKKQVHPSLPISIYNYTARAQYMGVWNESERVCRGLIVVDDTNEVIARGPSKFFNYGQTGAPEIAPTDLVQITRKEDGSLGIGWYFDGHYGVATRGSFTSDQAVHAGELLNADLNYEIKECYDEGMTKIFEIVYPDNRIVLDYADRDELIPLGEVGLASGLIEYREYEILHEVTTFYPIPFSQALAMPIPADEEGYVLDVVRHVEKFDGGYYDTIGHVKLKGEEYKILHGLLTNTNARRIWIQLAARDCYKLIKEMADRSGKNPDKLVATFLGMDPEDFNRVNVEQSLEDTLLTNVPDEFYDWVTKKIDSINDRVYDLIIQSITLAGHASMVEDRKTRYELVKDHPMCSEILRLVDSRDPSSLTLKAWSLAKPDGDDTPFKLQED